MTRRIASWLGISSSARAARRLVADPDIFWHQRFELVPGVHSRGPSDVAWLFERTQIPHDLTGKTVLDVGTANGGAAFLAERRGASRVVAVDSRSEDFFGFAQLKRLLGSHVEFVQTNVYDLPRTLAGERFGLVLFWGVLYHLRHPLVGLDAVREVAGGEVWIESQIADWELGAEASDLSLVRFYRQGFRGDPTNWFAPTARALTEWVTSCGLVPFAETAWPSDRPERAMLGTTVSSGPPEFEEWEAPWPPRASEHNTSAE